MKRVGTGIPELDSILGGGFAPGSLVVIAGAPGTGKTILAQQICFANATGEHRAIYYTTLSESHTKLIQHLEGFSFFDAGALGTRVEFNHLIGDETAPSVDVMLSEIVRKSFEAEPCVIVIDGARALHDYTGGERIRENVYDLASRVSHTNAVLIFVGEYEPEDLSRAPEFAVADAILYLANETKGARDARWLRVHKMRGTSYVSGQHSFLISDHGFEVYPRFESIERPIAALSNSRVSTGVLSFDQMLGGGLPGGSGTLIAGPSGAGKTVFGLGFTADGLERGERCVYVSLQESERQLLAKAKALGWDFETAHASGALSLVYVRPVELGLNVAGAQMRALIEGSSFDRIVVDSVAELEHAARGTDRFADFLWALVEMFRGAKTSAVYTYETSAFFGPSFQLAGGQSHVFDNVILLRYTELASEIRRAMGIVKMRDSEHVKSLVEFEIGSRGFKIKEKFAGVSGVLTGTPTVVEERFRSFFGR